MAKTVKLLGSGPLADKVFYAPHVATLKESGQVILQLDEPWGDSPYIGAIIDHVIMNIETGCLELEPGHQTDLISTGGYCLSKTVRRMEEEKYPLTTVQL